MNVRSEWGFSIVAKDIVGTTGEIKIRCADQKTDYINMNFKVLILLLWKIVSLFLGNKVLKRKKKYIKHIWKQQKQSNQPLAGYPEEPWAYCTDTKWKLFVLNTKQTIYFKYKKSKELGIQNNTGKSSLQYNQWYAGEKKSLLNTFALFHVSLMFLLESHQLPMIFSSHKQPYFGGMFFLSVLRMMIPFSLWRENDRCSHNFSLSHQILWG